MIKLRSLPLYVLASALLFPAFTQGQGVTSTARILHRIDESQLVALKGNTHPFANARHDQGKVADNLPMTDLILVLSRSAEQQAAFDDYVAGEYDENSPNYHQWLTPDQVGEWFGPSGTDIATITNWLTSHGLNVSQVTRDRMSIRFGGTAAQVESAFHTEIHNLTVKGVPHIANMSDPQIPAALSPVIVGVKSLHNFFPKPAHHMGQMVQRDTPSGMWKRPSIVTAQGTVSAAPRTLPNLPANSGTARPQFGIGVGGSSPYLVEDVSPWDFATIYNVTPLWSAKAPIDGTGQTIAIAGTSAIDIGEGITGRGGAVGANGLDDVRTFRTFFDLPTTNSWNTPIQVSGNGSALHVCTDTTGTLPFSSNPCEIDDLIENSLDVEWSGSVAKNAQIVLVASYPASATDDNLYDSESYIVDNVGNSSSPVYGVHVMNVSYGECELGLGTAGNVQYYDLWQTAAAEGIAVFVAAGDSGSAACDDGGDAQYGVPYPAQYGLTVSGIATTPYDTAVGGTDFNWCPLLTAVQATSTSSECQPAPYWSSTALTPPGSANASYSALGYVPEVPWNDTCTSPLALPYLKYFFNGNQYQGSGNQTYSVTDAETACNAILYYAQALYTQGDMADLALVDTVGGSGGASGCIVNSSTATTTGTCTTGATSTGSTTNPDTGAPQASLTVVNNGWPKPTWQTGVTGIPSDGVRDIPDVSFFASAGSLSSSAYLVCVSADTTIDGKTYQPCSYSNNVEPFAQEVGGTSVATPAMAGVMALINQKAGAAQGSPNKELYALAAKQTYSSCSAEAVTANSTGCYFNDIDTGTIAMACVYDSAVLSESASPNCTIAHAGDYIGILNGYSANTGYDQATGLGSLNVANVVNAWTATTPGSAMPTVTVTANPTSINTNNLLQVTVTAAGATGAPQSPLGQTIPPSGTVTLSYGTTYSATGALNNSGSATITVPANTLPGSAGGQSDTLKAAYAGDVNYAATSGTGQVTVSSAALLTPTLAMTQTPSGSTINVAVSVTGSGATPTGFVILSAASGSFPATTQWIGTSPCTSASNCVFTVQASSFTGTVTLTAQYSGDIHYAPGQNTVQVVGATFTLTPGTPSSSSVTPGLSATDAVSASAVNGYAGTVTLSCAQSSTTASGGDGTTCNVSNSGQINLATCGSSCSVTFTIGTTAPMAARMERPVPSGRGWLGAGSGAVLALLVFLGIPARRRSWRAMLSVLVALVALGVMSSCGGGGSSGGGGGGGQNDPGTTAGTYTYTVTASSTPSVTPTVTTTFKVVVN